MKRLLVVRLSSIGDVILTTPVLTAIKQRYPMVEIDYIVMKEYQEVLEGLFEINQIIPFDKHRYSGVKGIRDFIKNEVKSDYDLVIDLHAKMRSKLMTFFLKCPRVRYKKRALWKTIAVKLRWCRYRVDDTIVNNYFKPLAFLDIENIGEQLKYPRRGVSKSSERYGVIALGASKETKRWPLESFVQVANECGWPVKWVGDARDAERLKSVQKILESNSENFCGKLSLTESGSVIANASWVLCNDSAVFHIARAFQREVIAIFGPTDPGMFTFSKREHLLATTLSCQPCSLHGEKSCPKKHFNCMNQITPEEVLKIVEKITERTVKKLEENGEN